MLYDRPIKSEAPVRLSGFRDYVAQGAHLSGLGAIAGLVGWMTSPMLLAASAALTGVAAVALNCVVKVGPALSEGFTGADEFGIKPLMSELTSRMPGKRPVPISIDDNQRGSSFSATANSLGRSGITISKSLLKTCSSQEKKGIIGHELVHVGARHKEIDGAAVLIRTTAMLPLLPGIVSRPVSHILALTGVYATTLLIDKSRHRRSEFQADRIAASGLGGNPLALITALRKLDAGRRLDEPTKAAWSDCNIGSPFARSLKIGVSLLKRHPDIRRRAASLAYIAARKGADAEAIAAALQNPVDISSHPFGHLELVQPALPVPKRLRNSMS